MLVVTSLSTLFLPLVTYPPLLQENRGGGDGPEVDMEVNITGTEQDGEHQIDKGAQQEHGTEPGTQPTAVMVVPKKKPKCKTRKPLKKSVIRRLCKLPSKRGRSRISGAAEIMYTNPEFDLESNIYSHSNCTVPHKLSNLKARPQRSKSVRTKSKSKPKSKSKSQRNTKARTKKNTARPLRVSVTYNPPQCLCTEINGELYKVMDLPEGLEDLSCFLLGNRTGAKARNRRATGYRSTKR